jgi:ADP-ribose pyrophosphatase YjhB (NUDIX family)
MGDISDIERAHAESFLYPGAYNTRVAQLLLEHRGRLLEEIRALRSGQDRFGMKTTREVLRTEEDALFRRTMNEVAPVRRLGVAGLISARGRLLLGRRGKDPNRGKYVLPGGGVKEGETLDQAFCREVLEETGVVVPPDPGRFTVPAYVIELPDRIILVAQIAFAEAPPLRDGDDLYDVAWFANLPADISPVIAPVLRNL